MVCEMVLTEYKKRLVCVCIFIFCFISRFPYRKINVNKICDGFTKQGDGYGG